jgi:mannan endo-1,4-beta-mannosidase
MRDAGIKVLRTWVHQYESFMVQQALTQVALQGFNAINATELPEALASNLTYYQVWDGPKWKLNDGPQGLHRLDNIVETAGKYGIKVIIAFTNNW